MRPEKVSTYAILVLVSNQVIPPNPTRVPANEDRKRMGRIKPVPRAARRASTSPVWAALARARRWGDTSSSSEAPAKTSACAAMSSSSSLSPLRPPGTAICVEDCLGLKRGRRGERSRWRVKEKRNPLGGGFGSVTASGRLRATSGRKNLACVTG